MPQHCKTYGIIVFYHEKNTWKKIYLINNSFSSYKKYLVPKLYDLPRFECFDTCQSVETSFRFTNRKVYLNALLYLIWGADAGTAAAGLSLCLALLPVPVPPQPVSLLLSDCAVALGLLKVRCLSPPAIIWHMSSSTFHSHSVGEGTACYYVIQTVVTVITKAHHWILTWVCSIQIPSFQPILQDTF